MSTQPTKKVVRIALTEESCNKLNKWLTEVNTNLPGPCIRQKQLVEWLILSRPESLARSDIQSIRETYIDEVDLAEWALQEIRQARKSGRELKLRELVAPVNKPRRRKTNQPSLKSASPDNHTTES